MAVPVKTPIPISFAGSLDTKTDAKQVLATDFLVLNNMVYSVPAGGGGARLNKRNGFTSLGKTINAPNPALTYSNVGGTITSARKVYSFKDELLLNDPFNLYSYDEANDAWNYKGRSTTVALTTHSIVAGNTAWGICDVSVDTTTGIKVFAYARTDNTSVTYSIQDVATGQFIINQALLGAGYSMPRCVSISGKSWIFAVNTSDHKLYYQAIVGQTVTGPLTALITDLSTTHLNYDIDVDASTGNIYIAYYSSTPSVKISAVSSSMVVGNTITKVESGLNGVSWFPDGTNIWVVLASATNVKCFIVNNAVSATVLAPTTIDGGATAAAVNNVTGVYSSTQSKGFIFYDPITKTGAITTTAAVNFNTLTVGGAVGTPALFMGSVNINSKAFAVSGIPHIVAQYTYPIANGDVVQATNFLLNLYNLTPTMGSASNNDVIANIAVKISPDEASGVAPIAGHLAGIHQNTSGAWEMALLKNVDYSFTTPYSPFYSPTGVIDCQFDFSLTNPDVQDLGNNAVVAGGQVSMYDGANDVEQNFHIYPNSAGYTIGTSGGITTTVDSLYSYIYVYEWIDNQGQVHRSFPSPVVTPIAMGHAYTFAASTTNGSVALTVPTLRVTNKSGTQVVINIYRTLANGSVYFLLGAYGTLTNDPSVDSLTFTDVLPDGTIEGNIQLYTTGALGYFAPPATAALSNFKNRLLAVPYEGGSDFNYSNQVLPNFPVQFVPFFDQNVGTIGGNLITLYGMDDKIILLRSGKITGPAILYMVGQGPAPSGSGNDFTDPLPVAVDAGCVDRPSVVMTPVGLMFKSNKGIYLLSRNLEASYIGAPVEAFNQYSVLSAQLIPNTTQVRFLLSSGTMLVYDYFYKRWSTFSTPAGISDCIFQGQHTFVASDGTVYKESPSVYYDGTNTPVLMNFTTSWIKLAGIQGYQRAYWFYVLGEYISGHQLQFQISYDFATSPSQTTTITPDSSDNLENWRIFLAKQRCQAIQIAFQEVYTGTPGAGVAMSGINLYAGVKSSFRTFSAAKSVG